MNQEIGTVNADVQIDNEMLTLEELGTIVGGAEISADVRANDANGKTQVRYRFDPLLLIPVPVFN